ncbi:MAG: DUF255 domain-containing protein [Bacteroidetes bacterium]|jgi:uncharacterized protein YyaL (SSP411 family)|nr:DUF255 domain-containing protein [Bacteroidota bacterium]
MNRLQYETSPYLLQHAHNPVDWYAWKPEAFEQAKAEDKPILVSIGYSTCHWCHVMERESFENEAVAEFMNEHFINIKVDREERPDVDQIYMEACQAINGSGGWPLNCFLLPDGRPYFAGTYYPPQQMHNRPSWMQLMAYMSDAYAKRREEVEQQSAQLMDAIQRSERLFLNDGGGATGENGHFTVQATDNIRDRLLEQADREAGGFGRAPKFPGTMALRYLLDYHRVHGSATAEEHLTFSLDKMIRGGIYDQLGGGFARYATDRAWLVPHFEKMLYDNALLVGLLSDAYRAFGSSSYETIVRETLAWVEREMTSPEGGFYAALDADSEGEEGKFYVWQKSEIEALLSAEQSELCCAYYGVSEAGNWEGTNILHRPQSLADFAISRGMTREQLRAQLSDARMRLFAAREQRVRPGRDEKVILAWNAMMATAYAKAYAAFGEADYLEAAERNLDFLLRKLAMPDEPRLYHTYKDKQAQYEAYLDDYALLVEAMLAVYQVRFEEKWLHKARAITDYLLEYYLDSADNLFYFTAAHQKDLPLRRKEMYDSATPSGNSTMVHNLQRLAILYGREDYRRVAVELLQSIKASVEKYPLSFSRWARALLYEAHPFYELAVVGAQAHAKAKHLNETYLPNTVLMASATAQDNWPLLAGRSADGDTNIFICQEYACQQPVKTVEEAKERLVKL